MRRLTALDATELRLGQRSAHRGSPDGALHIPCLLSNKGARLARKSPPLCSEDHTLVLFDEPAVLALREFAPRLHITIERFRRVGAATNWSTLCNVCSSGRFLQLCATSPRIPVSRLATGMGMLGLSGFGTTLRSAGWMMRSISSIGTAPRSTLVAAYSCARLNADCRSVRAPDQRRAHHDDVHPPW